MEKEKLISAYTFPQKTSSDGYYHIAVADSSKKTGRKHIKAKTLDELKEKVYQFERGINGKTKKTFQDVFEIVQDEKLKYCKNPEKRLSVQNTISRNRSEYRRFFEGTEFERKYVSDISKKDIENIILANLQRLDLKKKGFASMKSILKSVFDLAYNEYWIEDNPYTRVDTKKYRDLLVADTPVSERVHSDSEVKKMLDYIHKQQSEKPSYIVPFALEFQMTCGLRRGEVAPFAWNNVFDDHILISREQVTVKAHDNIKEHFEIVEHTKTYKDRVYPMTEDLKEFLDRLRFIHMKNNWNSEFLFPADTENGCINNVVVYRFYHRMCNKLSIKIDPNFIKGTHAFRRNCITDVINKTNGNVIMASRLFGNSPDVATKNYYTGLNLDEAREVLNA